MKKFFVFACISGLLSFAACSNDNSTSNKATEPISKKKVIQSNTTNKVNSTNPLRNRLEISKKTTSKSGAVNMK